jgi:hypothetical protein
MGVLNDWTEEEVALKMETARTGQWQVGRGSVGTSRRQLMEEKKESGGGWVGERRLRCRRQ